MAAKLVGVFNQIRLSIGGVLSMVIPCDEEMLERPTWSTAGEENILYHKTVIK